jgi:undecaprenyl phosphate N,N'-diacetylbacillosamine 1-phosphate transferase
MQYKGIVKPFFDILFALVLLVLTSPFIIITAIVLFIQNRGDIFFLQQRPGKNAKPFYIIKFKTMRDTFDADGRPLPDHIRLTKAGALIRSLSLDELLQLINVFKGEMSLIGPRPLLMKYLPLYSPEQMRRHEVKPGISGWAQVNGRNAIFWSEKFKLDVYYVDHHSFTLDVKILFMTINKILFRKGISANDHATMDEFKGNFN